MASGSTTDSVGFAGSAETRSLKSEHISIPLCGLDFSRRSLLWPQYQGTVFTISQPAFFGEIALMLWGVIKGTKRAGVDAAA